jgi:hypothetical protein
MIGTGASASLTHFLTALRSPLQGAIRHADAHFSSRPAQNSTAQPAGWLKSAYFGRGTLIPFRVNSRCRRIARMRLNLAE